MSGLGSIDALIEPTLREARVADRWRAVGRCVDVVWHIRAGLENVEPVLVVARSGLAGVVPGDQIARVREDSVGAAGHGRDVNVVAPEGIPARAVRLPVVVAGDSAHLRL